MKKPDPPVPQRAFSIKQFCEAYGVSPAMFYKMCAEGWGPVRMKCGRRTLISVAAAERWCREREVAAEAAE